MPHKWTPEEDEFIRTQYTTMTREQLAAKFGVSKDSIRGKLRRLGLEREQAVPRRPEPPPTPKDPYTSANDLFYSDQPDYVKALEHYLEASRASNNRLLAAKALYRAGECYAKLSALASGGERREELLAQAVSTFQEVAEGYKEWYIADAARRRMEALQGSQAGPTGLSLGLPV